MPVLAFDYGQRRIGIAVGDSLTGRARGLQTLPTAGPGTANRIDQLICEWRPSALVFGWPTQADGKPTALAPALQEFATALGTRHTLPVYWANEHLTSHLARERMLRAGNKRNDPGLDAHAAALILEGWLLENPRDD